MKTYESVLASWKFLDGDNVEKKHEIVESQHAFNALQAVMAPPQAVRVCQASKRSAKKMYTSIAGTGVSCPRALYTHYTNYFNLIA